MLICGNLCFMLWLASGGGGFAFFSSTVVADVADVQVADVTAAKVVVEVALVAAAAEVVAGLLRLQFHSLGCCRCQGCW